MKKYLYFSLLCLVTALGYATTFQLEIPAKPSLETAVYDGAAMLTKEETGLLEQKLLRYADTTSTQIVVATIPSLQGEDIGLYATRWAHAWGIGQKDKDNGVFLLIAKKDRKLWLATGYGVEEKLTDYTCKQIIDQVITPEFKKGNFYYGIDFGVSAIMEVLAGTFEGFPEQERDTTSSQNAKSDSIIGKIIPIVFFIVFFLLITRFGVGCCGSTGGGRSIGGSGGSSFGGSSFGGFSSGGGFSGGFGGGGFGGGGAGGSW